MRVIHVASFQGNIGDQLNHSSFRQWFGKIVGVEIDWIPLEIRTVFRREKTLFEWVKEYSASSDLLVIGGGNFWETWPSNSQTGTSIDLSLDDLKRLNIPVFFNSIGLDTAQGVSEAASRLPVYLEGLLGDSQFFVSVRNDGARANLLEQFDFKQPVLELPDHGFFSETEFSASSDSRVLAVNVAQDMKSIRFHDGDPRPQMKALAAAISSLVDHGVDEVNLVPHVSGDLAAIALLCDFLPDKIVREKVRVAPLDTRLGDAGSKFNPYQSAGMVIATRFHANVAALASGTKLLPIVNYPQILLTLEGLPTPWKFPVLSEGNLNSWPEVAIDVMTRDPREYVTYSREILRGLESQRNVAASSLTRWLDLNLKEELH